jgi:hypothetical protein
VETRRCWAVDIDGRGLVDLEGWHALRSVCMVEYERFEDVKQTTEPSSRDSDANDPGSNDPNRDAEDEAPHADGAPRSDAIRTARLALQAMLGSGMPPSDDEDASSDPSSET